MTPQPMQTVDEPWRDRVNQFLKQSQLAEVDAPIVPLTGDASNRRYVRVIPRSGESFVLALYSKSFRSETLSFIKVASLLEQMEVSVPTVLEHATDLGVLALQDLGDVTLQAHLGTGSTSDHLAVYREAVDLITVIQRKGLAMASPSILPFTVTFDVKKFMWELDYFAEHFLEGYRGVTLSDDARLSISLEFQKLSEELASEPQVLCHRDYHSRNLMLHNKRLYVIDFQDARMGPATYDLVSLLRDSYTDLSEETIEGLIDRFLVNVPNSLPADKFRRKFDSMALQRNLKALGTFGYQTSIRRNPVYIQYIPRTIHYLQRTFDQNPRFDPLRGALAPFLQEIE
ncbi:MAG: phosphotransferase [Acidobacteriota bacterium]|nr:phosphotransferase [Acidobacteriota bacterium]MEE3138184.1 phosphotransferase [Acidobacteriota bacterium]